MTGSLVLDLAAHALGFLAILAVLRGREPWLAGVFGYPLGLVIWFAIVFLMALSGAPLSTAWIWIGAALGFGVTVVWCAAARVLSPATAIAYLVTGGLHAGTAAVSTYILLVSLPNDSWWYILIGRIAASKMALTAVSSFFDGYSAFLISANAMARTMGLDYWHSLPPQLGMSAAGALFVLAHRVAALRGLAGGAPVWVAILVTLLAGVLAFAELPVLVALMVNSHLHYAVLILGFFAFAWLYLETEEAPYGLMAAVALSASIPLRLESGVFAATLALIWAVFTAHLRRLRVTHAMAVPVMAVAWLVAQEMLGKSGLDSRLDHLVLLEDISRERWSIAFAAFYLVALMIIGLISRQALPLHKIDPVRLILSASLMIASALCLLAPERMATDLYAIVFHLVHVRWGDGWLLVALTAFLVMRPEQRPADRFLWAGVITFMFLILFSGFGRKPFHTVYTDSANRMLLHIFPAALMAVAVSGVSIATSLLRVRQKRRSLIGNDGPSDSAVA